MTRTIRLGATVASTIGVVLFAQPTAAHAVPAPPPSTPTGAGLVVWYNAASLDVVDVDVDVNLLIARPDGSGQLTLTPKHSGVADSDPTISPAGEDDLAPLPSSGSVSTS